MKQSKRRPLAMLVIFLLITTIVGIGLAVILTWWAKILFIAAVILINWLYISIYVSAFEYKLPITRQKERDKDNIRKSIDGWWLARNSAVNGRDWKTMEGIDTIIAELKKKIDE